MRGRGWYFRPRNCRERTHGYSWKKQQQDYQDGIEITIDLESRLPSNPRRTSSNRILYHSDHCVEASIGQKLKSLINSMDRKEFVVEDVADGIKRTDIISQYQHFPNYLQSMSDHSINKRVISLAPTIYSIKEQKFLTEINGLKYAKNKELYSLIEKIFNKFMPMFDRLLNKSNFALKDSFFDELPVIIKIQKYDITKECSFNGHWHSEGTRDDGIMAVGLYYFDISDSESLYFTNRFLEIAHQRMENTTVKMEIYENECMVFKNSDMRQIVKHRASFSTERWGNGSGHASRSVLSFFVQKKRKSHVNNPKYKWYNYPWKTDIIAYHFIKRDVCKEINDIIAAYAFGDIYYRQYKISAFVQQYVVGDENSNEKEPFSSIWWRSRRKCRRAS